ncbi:hypothetical protein DUI87_03304 [Hirundo rustica rustica]|uniref:Retroviral nucleocapsid Gag protein p24 C-terminal domain-containing protein n=1 Tax=Hirundo rustica rustica TaxID=333673 RepID=A0A3M0L9Q1_HIRRU|nr:hypothetical protein DUI87_03304 [Hirundo rustica rustica]
MITYLWKADPGNRDWKLFLHQKGQSQAKGVIGKERKDSSERWLFEHLCGDGEWVSALKQAEEIPLAVLELIKDAASKAFFSIQPNGPSQPYRKIKQLPSEPFIKFMERLTGAIELQVNKEGAQEQVLEEMALTNANEQCKAAILSLPMEPAPTLDDMLQQKSPDVIVKDPATRETKSPHDLVTWGRGYTYVSTPSGLKWVPAEWVEPFIPKSAKPPAEAPQVASAAWRR